MLWGFISEWSKNPFNSSIPRPFNARAESVGEKRLFRGSWRHKRCLLPASGFLEKGHRITRNDYQVFWLAGIWNRWMSPDGGELESCCVLTTEPNDLVRSFNKRMPVIIPEGFEEDWIMSVKDGPQLKELESMLSGWEPDEWLVEPMNSTTLQMSLL